MDKALTRLALQTALAGNPQLAAYASVITDEMLDQAVDSLAPVPNPFFPQLHDLFANPFGRDHKHWVGVQPPRTRHGHTMMAIREDDGVHRFAYDDTEYLAPPPKKVRFDDLARRSQRRVIRVHGDAVGPDTELLVDQPWRRLTPKVMRPGHARRARLRMEREAA